jgi:glucose uptake protein GlcU
MDSQQEKTNPPSDRPSFFGLPAGWRVWSQVGGQFWSGVLSGVGIGFLVAAVLVELELMTFQRKAWVVVIGIVLWWIGQMFAFRAVRRTRQSETNAPQSM